MIHVYTSAAVNYLPKVRLLCSSLKRYHPEFAVHWVIPDRRPEWVRVQDEPFDSMISIADLAIPNRESWIFQHSLVELCTAVKPFAMQSLLQRDDCESVLYFDPDIVVFSRLDDLLREVNQGSIGLTPHLTKPEQRIEAIVDNEVGSLRYGVFNLGFIAVRKDPNGLNFVRWWSQRLHRFCRANLEEGLWTDQKWINLVPILFNGVQIIKSSRFNVAAWNITTRNLTGSLLNSLMVDGQPLGFYHFSGWDSGAHKVMATKYGGDNPAVMELIHWYETANSTGTVGSPWFYGLFENGERIMTAHRAIYRIRGDLQNAFPNPFSVNNGHCYYNWCKSQASIEHPELFK